MIKEHFRYKETIVTISADDSHHIDVAKAEILRQRRNLESYIAIDPVFETTLEPHECLPQAPDIALINDRKTYIGIFAGQSVIRNLAFEIESRNSILGICTSSGTVGASISFGLADAVTVISKDVALADAMATATANRIPDKESIAEALRFAESVDGTEGVSVIKDDAMGRCTNIDKSQC